jgi:hypothetical protein
MIGFTLLAAGLIYESGWESLLRIASMISPRYLLSNRIAIRSPILLDIQSIDLKSIVISVLISTLMYGLTTGGGSGGSI